MKFKWWICGLFVIAFFAGQLHGGLEGITETGFNILMFVISVISGLAALILIFIGGHEKRTP